MAKISLIFQEDRITVDGVSFKVGITDAYPNVRVVQYDEDSGEGHIEYYTGRNKKIERLEFEALYRRFVDKWDKVRDTPPTPDPQYAEFVPVTNYPITSFELADLLISKGLFTQEELEAVIDRRPPP